MAVLLSLLPFGRFTILKPRPVEGPFATLTASGNSERNFVIRLRQRTAAWLVHDLFDPSKPNICPSQKHSRLADRHPAEPHLRPAVACDIKLWYVMYTSSFSISVWSLHVGALQLFAKLCIHVRFPLSRHVAVFRAQDVATMLQSRSEEQLSHIRPKLTRPCACTRGNLLYIYLTHISNLYI